MTPELAELAAQFLQRITLQPNEINTFQTVMQGLQEDALPLKEAPDGLTHPDPCS